jgi:hypothetical protein
MSAGRTEVNALKSVREGMTPVPRVEISAPVPQHALNTVESSETSLSQQARTTTPNTLSPEKALASAVEVFSAAASPVESGASEEATDGSPFEFVMWGMFYSAITPVVMGPLWALHMMDPRSYHWSWSTRT